MIGEDRPDLHKAIANLRQLARSGRQHHQPAEQHAEHELRKSRRDSSTTCRHITDNMNEFTETIKTRPYTLIRASGLPAREPGSGAAEVICEGTREERTVLTRRFQHAALVVLIAASVAGCGGSRPVKYYVARRQLRRPPFPPRRNFRSTLLVSRVTAASDLYRDDRLVYGSGTCNSAPTNTSAGPSLPPA